MLVVVESKETALINTNLTIDAGKRFQLLTTDGKVAYEGPHHSSFF